MAIFLHISLGTFGDSMKKTKKKKDHFSEFSKFILFLFAISYFIGGAFIIWVVHYQLLHTLTPEYISSQEVVMYFTAPVTGGLLAYFGKAAVENFEKIKTNSSIKNEKNTEDRIAKG